MDQQREIEQIAYELYLKRGGTPGDPAADWFTAERIYIERQLQGTTSTTEVEATTSAATAPRKTTRKKADTAKTVAPKVEKTVKATTTRTKKAAKKE